MEHSWYALARVDVEGEEAVQRAGSPIVKGSGEEEEGGSLEIGGMGSKVVKIWGFRGGGQV